MCILYARGAGLGTRGTGPRRDQQRDTRTCYLFDKPRHLKQDCHELERAAHKQGGVVGAALVTHSTVQHAGKLEGPSWTLCSSCTNYLTGDSTRLQDHREVCTPWTINIADRSARKVVGVGKAGLDPEIGLATLHGVLHVPGLGFNLASVM
jgi:hypothetical protein